MFLEYTKKKLINKSIVEYLQVKNQDIISISGAGGKTSTIKLLTKNLMCEHKKVLITTTTKMFKTADAKTIRDKNLLKQKLEQQKQHLIQLQQYLLDLDQTLTRLYTDEEQQICTDELA